MQSAPCALVKLIHFFGNDPTSKQTTINVTFHDARKKLPGKMLELAYLTLESKYPFSTGVSNVASGAMAPVLFGDFTI